MLLVTGDEEVRVQGDAEAYVALYDAQAVRLHAYCWSLVGDRAAAAVHDVFTAAAYPAMTRQDASRRDASHPGMPPTNVWLYRRARAECLRRGPVTVISGRDPLLRAAARLRADQREVLVLAADFAPHDVARVLAVPPATVMQLHTDARARLEQAALSVLLADPATAMHEDIIGAFEKGTLGTLLARRAPAPPRELREVVVSTFARERAPLVVISPPAKQTQGADGQKGRPAARHAKVAAPVIGVAAACAAAVVGAMAAGATLDFDTSNSGGGNGALAPSSAGQSPGSQGAQSGGGGQPSIGESPAADVTPTTSAEPRPVQTDPSQPPSPESSSSPSGGLLPGLQSPEGQRSTAPDPSDPADSDTPNPPDSSSPSDTPSSSPSGGGGLLGDLPILGRVVGSLSDSGK